MKTLFILIAAALCPSLAATAFAQRGTAKGGGRLLAPGVHVQQTPLTPPSSDALPDPGLADLRCTISAWEDAAGTKPIANGAQLVSGNELPSSWMRIVVTNGGFQEAEGFNVSISLKKNGSAIPLPFATPPVTLSGGFANKTYPLFEIAYPQPTTQVQATVLVDAGGVVAEGSEQNNSCSLSFKMSHPT